MWWLEQVCDILHLAAFLAGEYTHIFTGPAHAVYFATYEAVKHVMGGNQAGVHHPLAAGTFWSPRSFAVI